MYVPTWMLVFGIVLLGVSMCGIVLMLCFLDLYINSRILIFLNNPERNGIPDEDYKRIKDILKKYKEMERE